MPIARRGEIKGSHSPVIDSPVRCCIQVTCGSFKVCSANAVIAIMQSSYRNAAVGYIDWLGLRYLRTIIANVKDCCECRYPTTHYKKDPRACHADAPNEVQIRLIRYPLRLY